MGYKAGITLIELLITVAIAGILATLAAPSFEKIIIDNRLAAATNELIATLHLARTEAVRRNARVTLCPSTDGQNCSQDGHWEHGWLVFEDRNRDGRFQPSNDRLLRRQGPLSRTVTVTFPHPRVTYAPTGLLYDAGVTNGTFKICDRWRGNDGRAIVLNRAGRPQLREEERCP